MTFSLSDDERMIAEAAAEVLASASDSAAVRACCEAGEGIDRALWRQVAGELGWCAVGIDEAHGGMGMGTLTEALLFEQSGAHLLCAPLFSTVALGANLLRNVSSDSAAATWLPAVAEGRCSLSAPLPDSPNWADAAATLRAEAADGAWRLRGQAARVPDAAQVDALICLAEVGDGSFGLFAVDRDAKGVSVLAQPGWDATRVFGSWTLDSAPAERLDADGAPEAGLRRAAAIAQLHIAAESLGGAQRCLDLTTAYVAERKQFGRPVGSFQAVKHRCAQMMVEIEALRSGVLGAARLAEQGGDDAQLAAECAALRARADRAFFFCAQEAIQLHGGVGFTWEYDPQLYFKRAQAARVWLGRPERLAENVAAYLLDDEAA
jgi:alkylation response protein AidB-like acyl-CoA dehydrogenase